MKEFLQRYTAEQQEVISKYWDTIRWTRKHGKISDKIKEAEMDYWSRFDAASVVAALEIHINKYTQIKEHYTRGIIRNIAADNACLSNEAQKDYKHSGQKPQAQRKSKKSRFANYEQREWDYEVLEHINRLHIMGQLDEQREELKKDSRYAKYL